MAKKLSDLPDGTGVRFNYLKDSGFSYRGEVQNGQILDPNGDERSPNGAAKVVDKIIRGEDARESGWSPSQWEWYSGDGWEELTTSDS